MIKVENVTKYFGPFPAITDVSFEVAQGEILGFLGPNGAGKSTTMKIIVGFLPFNSGKVTVAGYDILSESLEARRHIGYLPETVPLYTDMTVQDYLAYMGRLRGMSGTRIRARTTEVVDICRLHDYYGTHIAKLSKGFRQRVGIAQAILHEPQVLVLDEPTLGIDPNQVVETREMIKGLGGDHTVIVSTHILPEVSMICERVVIIHQGEVVAVDSPENLAARLHGDRRIEIEIVGPQREVMQAIGAVEGVRAVELNPRPAAGCSYTVHVEDEGDPRARLASVVVHGGWELLRLESGAMSLEEIFVQLTAGEEQPRP